MTEFQDVWKLTALCRLFHSFSFGASFPVSIEEFLWDLSFIVKHLFLGVLGLETWRTSPEFFAWGKGRWIKTDRRMHSTLFHPSPLLVIILFLLLLIKAQCFTIHKVWMLFRKHNRGDSRNNLYFRLKQSFWTISDIKEICPGGQMSPGYLSPRASFHPGICLTRAFFHPGIWPPGNSVPGQTAPV